MLVNRNTLILEVSHIKYKSHLIIFQFIIIIYRAVFMLKFWYIAILVLDWSCHFYPFIRNAHINNDISWQRTNSNNRMKMDTLYNAYISYQRILSEKDAINNDTHFKAVWNWKFCYIYYFIFPNIGDEIAKNKFHHLQYW